MRFRVSLGLIASVMVALAPLAARADDPSVLRWELVGHIADLPIVWLAVPPDGLASGALFAQGFDRNGVQHAELPGQRPTDLCWSASGGACVQVSHDDNGNLQGQTVRTDAADCVGAGEATLPGSSSALPTESTGCTSLMRPGTATW